MSVPMSHVAMSPFLRRVLHADAALSAGAGLLMAAGGAWLQERLAIPLSLLLPVGIGMLAYAALLVALSRQGSLPRGWLWGLVAGNALWALECVAVVAAGWVTPNTAGLAFVALHVLAGVVFAELQFMALRRPRHLAVA